VDIPENSKPREVHVAIGHKPGVVRGIAYIAGQIGAFCISPALWPPIGLILLLFDMRFDPPPRLRVLAEGSRFYLLVLILGVTSLVPFAIALARGRSDSRRQILVSVSPGLVVGLVVYVVFFNLLGWGGQLFYAVIWDGVGLIGSGLGLLALGLCWRRGDTHGRALALLGIAPLIARCLLGALLWLWDAGYLQAAWKPISRWLE
jgi:hypothetical protein